MKSNLIHSPCTNHPLWSKVAVLFLGIAMFSASSAASAYAIRIEPDHYEEGTNLSTVAPYVTLQSLDGTYGKGPVHAIRSRHDYASPTGKLGFGNHPIGWTGCALRIECAQGFAMTFHQPVDWVSLKAINNVYGYEPKEPGDTGPSYGLPAEWYAFDAEGEWLASGLESSLGNDLWGANLGVVFEMRWAIPGMASLVVGGWDSMNAIQFDDLRFKLTQATVPEPGSLGLIGVTLGISIVSRRMQRHLT